MSFLIGFVSMMFFAENKPSRDGNSGEGSCHSFVSNYLSDAP